MHGERGRVERAATSVLWSALCAARASLVRSCGALSVSNWVRRGVRVRVGCGAVGRLAYSFLLFAIARMFEELLGFVLCKEAARFLGADGFPLMSSCLQACIRVRVS